MSKKYLIYSDYNYETNNLGEKGKITSLIDAEGNSLVVGDCVSFKQKDGSTFGDSIVIIDDLHPKGTCLYYSYGNLNAFDGFLRHGSNKFKIEKNLNGSISDFKGLSYLEREDEYEPRHHKIIAPRRAGQDP